MKKVLSLILAFVIIISTGVPALALTQKEKLDNISAMAEFMQNYGLSTPTGEDPFTAMLLKLLEDDEFYNAFMNSMLGQYDRYSLFVPAGNYDTMYPQTSSYVGVGITMEQYGEVVRIAKITENSPAAEADFRAGDIIIGVDRRDFTKATIEEVGNLVRGDEGTSVIITVKRVENGKDLIISKTITRKYIGVPNFTAKDLGDGVFYMDFTRFADFATFLDFVEAIRNMAKAKATSLILDLRDNPGGEVDMAFNVINRLVPDKVTYFMTRSKAMGQSRYTFYDSDAMGPALNKIVILQNENSASASEIIISSLVDLGYAVSVGDTTYGKARGQYHLELDDGSVAVVTGIELIAPQMSDYDGVGIEPTYSVQNKKVLDENGIEVFVDLQMEKALELARGFAKEPAKYTGDVFGNFKNHEPPIDYIGKNPKPDPSELDEKLEPAPKSVKNGATQVSEYFVA